MTNYNLKTNVQVVVAAMNAKEIRQLHVDVIDTKKNKNNRFSTTFYHPKIALLLK
jgi:hypothetical protein